jgi:ribosome biogenesis protein SSF1/2
MRINEARRVILYTYNAETDLVEFRHYAITVASSGLSRSVKSLLKMNIPSTDVEEFMARGLMGAESDAEDEDSKVEVTGKTQKQIKLIELGPRMSMQLVKIQQGVCGGEVIHHTFVTKTAEEIQTLEQRKLKEAVEKKARREEQERRVKAKGEVEFEEEVEEADGDEEMDEDLDDGDEELDDGMVEGDDEDME